MCMLSVLVNQDFEKPFFPPLCFYLYLLYYLLIYKPRNMHFNENIPIHIYPSSFSGLSILHEANITAVYYCFLISQFLFFVMFTNDLHED